MRAFAMNLLLGLCWLFLSAGTTLVDFFVGFLLGFLLMAAFQEIPYCRDYVRRTLALLKFAWVFTSEYLKANVHMAWMVLTRPAKKIQGGMIRYSVEGMEPLEILILSHIISLTPGSTTVEVSQDFRFLLLHLFDASNPDETREQIDRRFRDGLLAFTRSTENPEDHQ